MLSGVIISRIYGIVNCLSGFFAGNVGPAQGRKTRSVGADAHIRPNALWLQRAHVGMRPYGKAYLHAWKIGSGGAAMEKTTSAVPKAPQAMTRSPRARQTAPLRFRARAIVQRAARQI